MSHDNRGPRLPPGQRAVEGFPRFGTHLHRPPPPVPSHPTLRVSGAGADVTVDVADLDRDRTELLADFHCVAGWSAVGLRWEGVPFARFYEHAIAPTLAVNATVTHFTFTALDGYRAVATAEDMLAADVFLATRLNGEPVGPDHGAPLRLVSPSQYGYQSVKHLCAIELLTSEPRLEFGSASKIASALMRRPIFAQHPRSRVWAEERNRVLPNWLVRPLYRAFTPPIRKLSERASPVRRLLAR